MEEAAPPPPPPPPAPPAPAFSPTADAGLLARIDALFRAVDIDRSGEIDLSELRNYFGDVCEPLLRELDSIVVDGEVSEEEWRAFLEVAVPGTLQLCSEWWSRPPSLQSEENSEWKCFS